MQKKLPKCPVETALLMIGDKWKFLILRELVRYKGEKRRFSDFKKGINNISDKMLSQNLKLMEEDELIKREVSDSKPPKVEYSLTELGESLTPVLKSLYDWGLMYQEINSEEGVKNE